MNQLPRHFLARVLHYSLWLFIVAPSYGTDDQEQGNSLALLMSAIEQTHDSDVRAALLQGMLEGLEGQRNVPEPAGWPQLGDQLTSSPHPAVRERALQLSQLFGDALAVQGALGMITDKTMDPARRRSALYLLLNQQNQSASDSLEALMDEPGMVLDAIHGYAIMENPEAPAILVDQYPRLDIQQRRAVLETLASRKAYAPFLLEAVRQGNIARNDVPAQVSRSLHDILGKRWVEVFGENNRPIAEQRENLLQKYREICKPESMKSANASRGRRIFEKTCAACHLLYGQGGKVGPDLTGSNRANLEYVLLNSVDPSFDVADAYKTIVVETVDGRIINGVLDEEDETRLVLRTADHPRVVIAKENIEGQRTSQKSIMPEGQLDQMQEQDVIDLVQYLRTSEQVSLDDVHQKNELPGKQHKISQAPFLDPQQAVDKMSVPPGFDVSVFASEPDIAEPIAFCFDDRGRIWVVENFNYRTRRDHTDDPVSRIQILEDTDGDGVFDKKKTFTDKLTFTSGIACGMGGVFVGSPPNLSFIPDADGDDVPDGPPRVLLDGWGINDRHETLNSFIWGPDGWLYGCHGVFTMSHVGQPGQEKKDRQFIDGGIWRYHPSRGTFEVFARGLSNPWGFDFDDKGQGFATCCVIPHLFHVVQGGVYHKQSRPHLNPYIYDDIKTIRDHTHLSAHGGARFYLADAFPEKYHGRLFMCNIHEHAVLTDVMVPNGSSFIGQHGDDFLPANDMAWVGFSVQIGPEGAVYILDWHDQDVCGNSIQFPDSGRVYRILPTDAKPIQRPNLRDLTDDELVDLQTHSSDWYVRQARTQLQYRAANGKLNRKRVHAKLRERFQSQTDTAKQLRALWALHVTQGTDPDYLYELLGHPNQHVRAWAIQLLGDSSQVNAFQPHSEPDKNQPPVYTKQVRQRFASLARNDPSPVVRLYLASAIERMPFAQRWPILEGLVMHPEDVTDNNLARMYWFALEPMVPEFPSKAIQLVTSGSIPALNQFVARRLITGDRGLQQKRRGANEARENRAIQTVASGFKVSSVGELGVVKHREFRNRAAVQTHPLDRQTPCWLSRKVDIPKRKKTKLKMRVSHHPHGDWQLRVLANGQLVTEQIVGPATVGQDEWLDVEVDLTRFGGQSIELVIENRANNWHNEWAYWNLVKIVSE